MGTPCTCWRRSSGSAGTWEASPNPCACGGGTICVGAKKGFHLCCTCTARFTGKTKPFRIPEEGLHPDMRGKVVENLRNHDWSKANRLHPHFYCKKCSTKNGKLRAAQEQMEASRPNTRGAANHPGTQVAPRAKRKSGGVGGLRSYSGHEEDTGSPRKYATRQLAGRQAKAVFIFAAGDDGGGEPAGTDADQAMEEAEAAQKGADERPEWGVTQEWLDQTTKCLATEVEIPRRAPKFPPGAVITAPFGAPTPTLDRQHEVEASCRFPPVDVVLLIMDHFTVVEEGEEEAAAELEEETKNKPNTTSYRNMSRDQLLGIARGKAKSQKGLMRRVRRLAGRTQKAATRATEAEGQAAAAIHHQRAGLSDLAATTSGLAQAESKVAELQQQLKAKDAELQQLLEDSHQKEAVQEQKYQRLRKWAVECAQAQAEAEALLRPYQEAGSLSVLATGHDAVWRLASIIRHRKVRLDGGWFKRTSQELALLHNTTAGVTRTQNLQWAEHAPELLDLAALALTAAGAGSCYRTLQGLNPEENGLQGGPRVDTASFTYLLPSHDTVDRVLQDIDPTHDDQANPLRTGVRCGNIQRLRELAGPGGGVCVSLDGSHCREQVELGKGGEPLGDAHLPVEGLEGVEELRHVGRNMAKVRAHAKLAGQPPKPVALHEAEGLFQELHAALDFMLPALRLALRRALRLAAAMRTRYLGKCMTRGRRPGGGGAIDVTWAVDVVRQLDEEEEEGEGEGEGGGGGDGGGAVPEELRAVHKFLVGFPPGALPNKLVKIVATKLAALNARAANLQLVEEAVARLEPLARGHPPPPSALRHLHAALHHDMDGNATARLKAHLCWRELAGLRALTGRALYHYRLPAKEVFEVRGISTKGGTDLVLYRALIGKMTQRQCYLLIMALARRIYRDTGTVVRVVVSDGEYGQMCSCFVQGHRIPQSLRDVARVAREEAKAVEKAGLALQNMKTVNSMGNCQEAMTVIHAECRTRLAGLPPEAPDPLRGRPLPDLAAAPMVEEGTGQSLDLSLDRWRPHQGQPTLARLILNRPSLADLVPQRVRDAAEVPPRLGDAVYDARSNVYLGRVAKVDQAGGKLDVRPDGGLEELVTIRTINVRVFAPFSVTELLDALNVLSYDSTRLGKLVGGKAVDGDGLKRGKKIGFAVVRDAALEVLELIMYKSILDEVETGSSRFGPARSTREAVYFPSASPLSAGGHVTWFQVCMQHCPKNLWNRIVHHTSPTVFDLSLAKDVVHNLHIAATVAADREQLNMAAVCDAVFEGTYDKQSTSICRAVAGYKPLQDKLIELGHPLQARFLRSFEEFYGSWDVRGITPDRRELLEDRCRNMALNLYGHHLDSPKPVPDAHVAGLPAGTLEHLLRHFDTRRALTALDPGGYNPRRGSTTDISELGFMRTDGLKQNVVDYARRQAKNEGRLLLKMDPHLNSFSHIKQSNSKIYSAGVGNVRMQEECYTDPQATAEQMEASMARAAHYHEKRASGSVNCKLGRSMCRTQNGATLAPG